MIITTLDSITSLIAGIAIFGILGNLAINVGETDIGNVIKSGAIGLVFISYPDAIAKFTYVPQVDMKMNFFFFFSLHNDSTAIGTDSSFILVVFSLVFLYDVCAGRWECSCFTIEHCHQCEGIFKSLGLESEVLARSRGVLFPWMSDWTRIHYTRRPMGTSFSRPFRSKFCYLRVGDSAGRWHHVDIWSGKLLLGCRIYAETKSFCVLEGFVVLHHSFYVDHYLHLFDDKFRTSNLHVKRISNVMYYRRVDTLLVRNDTSVYLACLDDIQKERRRQKRVSNEISLQD